ncbi:hypothetical protein ROTAS13_04448 [Roseomonas sp. TAS13]|jgi:hypothetical protein|uniref:hypothetical protein n=1 Tax=Roseomonas sp. TAS13 TaxID=1926319 RepID=UPI000967DFFD|nr:hypothetical protein [Roseomonas sp. TAS13]USQ74333.1 hypothetical protein NF552_23565 [Roseomonas mucosa]GAV36760.1 hypothetical protein ROTAS13_04448 [Roseomonas sp. TAS13]
MDLAKRVARRQGRRQDIEAVIGLVLIVLILFGGAMLPGLLTQHASTVAVPAQEVRR